MKGSIVSGAIAVAIVVASTVIVVNVISPVVDEGEIQQNINFIKNILTDIDSAVNELNAEAPGASRSIDIPDIGEFIVSEDENRVRFRLNNVKYTEGTGIIQDGRVTISGGPVMKAYQSDVDSDGVTDLVLENQALLFAVPKTGSSSSYAGINTSDIVTLVRNKRTNTDISPVSSIKINSINSSAAGNGHTFLSQEGLFLSSSSIVVVMNTTEYDYTAVFSLSGGADYVDLKISGINYKGSS